MGQAATVNGAQQVPTASPSASDTDLVAEVLELRAENEQLHRALSSRAVIDQARGMLMALAPCSSERAWGLLVDCRSTATSNCGRWPRRWSPRPGASRSPSGCNANWVAR
ncbi:ANTAR domain-containing protein [Streptomyces anatolicus]|uniref:ANTAR domain-containing protein n=1 Tax=Streptomyces anatolicus TaxID=2675858 RepID=UPI002155E8A4|nr:ANTAR domain-containing protein [Streptomyces anatolicus]